MVKCGPNQVKCAPRFDLFDLWRALPWRDNYGLELARARMAPGGSPASGRTRYRQRGVSRGIHGLTLTCGTPRGDPQSSNLIGLSHCATIQHSAAPSDQQVVSILAAANVCRQVLACMDAAAAAYRKGALQKPFGFSASLTGLTVLRPDDLPTGNFKSSISGLATPFFHSQSISAIANDGGRWEA